MPGDWWCCTNHDCGATGPADDTDGTKWNALMSGSPKPLPAGTVRVRVPVVVDAKGNWGATGWSTDQTPDGEKIYHILGWEVTSEPSIAHWISADIPMPVPVEVKGEVK